MPAYDYEALGPQQFQALCQALLVQEYQSNFVRSFPLYGADGGRDSLVLLEDVNEDPIVCQVKFMANPRRGKLLSWLRGTITDELDRLSKGEQALSKFLLMTNAQGTGVRDRGSIDQIDELLSSFDVPVNLYLRDDLDRRLDNSWDLKWAFPALLTGGDILRLLVEDGVLDTRRDNALRSYLAEQYSVDQKVRFKQIELTNKLLDLYTDVPCSPQNSYGSRQISLSAGFRYAGTTIYRGALKEPHSTMKGAADFFLAQNRNGQHQLSVLEGAPGQGKSTITQYICQVHRMRLLPGKESDLAKISPAHREAPLRIPFKVDLRDLEAWLQRRNPFDPHPDADFPAGYTTSLESFLAAQVHFLGGAVGFDQNDLIETCQHSSVLFAFDGLDEVADVKLRERVVACIQSGVNRLQSSATSLQVIVTSRPAAFANSPGMSAEIFDYFELQDLSLPLVQSYAERWTSARELPDQEAADVKEILSSKMEQPHLRDLARNPMQLAILLSLLHTRGSSLPDKRTALYDNYIQLFFNREAEKSRVVREHRDLLLNIHWFVAWKLHADAGLGKGRGRIELSDLRDLLRRFLEREGYEANLANELMAGMVERIVALISRVEGTYEFEVQPLREYFAARFLYETAPYSPAGDIRVGTKPERFLALAKDFYWFNVLRFYAGCYSRGELASLIENIQDLLEDPQLNTTSYPSQLALTLLSDWVFSQHPRSVDRLITLVLSNQGIRRFAAERGVRRQAETIVLPGDCGRSKLVEHAFRLLKSGVAEDTASNLLEIIASNARPAESYDMWRAGLAEIERGSEDSHAPATITWLSYLSLLKVGQAPVEAEISKLLFDTSCHELAHAILLQRTPESFPAPNTKRMELTKLATRKLDDYTDLFDSRSGVLFSSSALLLFMSNPFHFLRGLDRRIGTQVGTGHAETPFNESLRAFSRHQLFKGLDASQGEDPTLIEACRDIYSLVTETPPEMWKSTLGPWTRLIEILLVAVGPTARVIALANLGAGIASQEETCTDATDLYSESTPLSRRFRYARLRAGSAIWWNKTLSSGRRDAMRICNALSIIFVWGSQQTLFKLSALLTELTEQLEPRLWRMVYEIVEICTEHPNVRRFRFSHSEAMSNVSPRVLTILSHRVKGRYLWQDFGSFWSRYEGEDPVIHSRILYAAINEFRSGKGNLDFFLSMIERSYRHLRGRFGHKFWSGNVSGLSRSSLNDHSVSHLTKIAEAPENYPDKLVAASQMSIRQDFARQSQRVGEVAKSWSTLSI